MYTTNSPSNADLPITALCIVSDKSRCPPNHTPVVTNYDFPNTEPDLWKDSLFGKRINRYFCYTKDYPINGTNNVIEDIKLLNESTSTFNGFIPLEKCLDTSEKSFQKKTVFIKITNRDLTTTAVSDIIVQKNKRAPTGYSYIGEINNHAVCIKFSQIPRSNVPNRAGSLNSSASMRPQGQPTPPPIPPRPHSNSNSNMGGTDPLLNDYVAWPRLPPVPPQWGTNGPSGSGFPVVDVTSSYRELDFNPHRQSLASSHAQTGFNPLNGVPFHINPSYTSNVDSSLKDDLIDAEQIHRKVQSFKKTLENTKYDLNLERQLVASTP